MVAFDAAHVGVHGEPASKGDGQIVAKRAELATLILEVVDKLGVLAIFSGQDLTQLENGCVERRAAVTLEDIGNGREDPVAEEYVGPGPVLCALGRLEVEGILVILGIVSTGREYLRVREEEWR